MDCGRAPLARPGMTDKGEKLARCVRKTRLFGVAQAGGRRDFIRQSRHHRTAVDGRAFGRHRAALRARPAGGDRHRHGRRLCPGLGQARGGQPARHARPRQRHGHAVRRAEGRLADPGHCRPARPGFQLNRADPVGRPAAHRAAVGEMVRRSASPRRSAAAGASRGENRAGAAERAGVSRFAGRHSQSRWRARSVGADPRRGGAARRSGGSRGSRGAVGAGQAPAHRRRRRGGQKPGACRTRRTRRAHWRAGLCRTGSLHRIVPGVASAVSRRHDADAGADPENPRTIRPLVLGRRRSVHACRYRRISSRCRAT